MFRFLQLFVVLMTVAGVGLLPLTAIAQNPPPSSPADALRLLNALKGLKDVKTPQQAAAAAASLADQLRNLNIPGAINGLDKTIPAETGSDLVALAGLLGAAQNGDLAGALNGAYDELARRKNLPLTPDEKNKLLDDMKKLDELRNNMGALTGKLDQMKKDLLDKLKKAGMDAAAKALDDLINGKGDKKGLTDLLKGTDAGKLKNLFKNNPSGGGGGSAAWKALGTTKQADLGKDTVAKKDIFKYMAMGYDAPFQFRPNNGASMSATGQFEQFKTSFCDPTGVCRNSTGTRTDASKLPPGYLPQNNPNLTIPEIPWKKVSQTPLPCGAVGGLTEIALQTLWGNVHLNIPPQVKTLINGKLKDLLGKLWGKKKDCQDGSFWATLSNLINVILPQLGLKGPGFVFDRSNNTFLAPPNTMIGLPLKSTFTVDLSAGSSYFILPVGGYFVDGHGQKINIEHNVEVQFMQDGTVTTSDGGNYRVPPGGMVTLDPNGVVGVPTGTPIPVPPETTLFPMGPMTVAPDWAHNPVPPEDPTAAQKPPL